MRPSRRGLALSAAVLALVAGCTTKDDVLPGERHSDLRDLASLSEQLAADQDPYETVLRRRPVQKIPNAPYAVAGEAQAISLGQPVNVTAWTHRYLDAAHNVPHLRLTSGPLTQVWTANFGEGNTQRTRVTVAPVIENGRIFVLDSLMTLTAFNTNGGVLWRKDLVPSGEIPGEVAGGGLAVQNGELYVTTGFGALLRLNAATGDTVWTQEFDSALVAPPVVDGTLVYGVSRDGYGYAIDRQVGRIVWEIEGTAATTSVLGASAPAIAGNDVIFAFPNGQLQTLLKEGGVSLWTASVGGQRVGRAYAKINAVAGGPVVVGQRIYVATASGRLAALDRATGARDWTTLEGATGPVVAGGGSLFFVSDEQRLVRVDAATGATIWAATLPRYLTEKVKKRQDVYAHFGPILAGGRVILASSDGLLREIDPASGQILRETDLGAPAVAEPIVVDGTLYVITGDGILHAFR